MGEIIIEGLTATVIGMGMVFGVLTILCVVLSFFKYLNPPEPEKKPAAAEAKPDVHVGEPEESEADVYDDSELIAVISAAVAACAGEGARIASITNVAAGKTVRTAYRGWTAAAIRENHRGLY